MRLDDGRVVGLSVGGRGVPLVFFHGIGMNRRVYLRVLSRLPQLGFLVVAIDAPGHGDTFAPRPHEATFEHRVDVTQQILDQLGIGRCVLMGHSMGGRTAAELAARQPERALAVVLVNPALGGAFDASRQRINSALKSAAGLTAAVHDTIHDRVGLSGLGHVRHFQTLGGLFLTTMRHPRLFSSAAVAIATSSESGIALRKLRSAQSAVVIIHGEKDMIVPLGSAVDAATLSGATLVTLPDGHHSWLLTTPWTFAEILNELITEQRLGREIDAALTNNRAPLGDDRRLTPPLYRPDAPILAMAPPKLVLGRANPRRRNLYHPWRIWEPDEIG
jgi:pimeloyl-ACP methyl ester carboxylesterase